MRAPTAHEASGHESARSVSDWHESVAAGHWRNLPHDAKRVPAEEPVAGPEAAPAAIAFTFTVVAVAVAVATGGSSSATAAAAHRRRPWATSSSSWSCSCNCNWRRRRRRGLRHRCSANRRLAVERSIVAGVGWCAGGLTPKPSSDRARSQVAAAPSGPHLLLVGRLHDGNPSA